MGDNNREPRNGFATWGSGDSGTAFDVLTLRGEATLEVNNIHLFFDNAGTNSADVELYDDDEGTSAGSLSNQFADLKVTAGDGVVLSDVAYDDIENDVVGVVRNNDDEVIVEVGGYLVSG